MTYRPASYFYSDRDPVAWAKLHGEMEARSTLHFELLDAMIKGDDGALGQLIEKSHSYHTSVENPFITHLSLPNAILALTNSNQGIMARVREAGVEETTRVGNSTPPSDMTWGMLAVSICTVEQQSFLLDAGFLSAKQQALHGMQSSDPDIFNLWCDAYCGQLVSPETEGPKPNLSTVPAEVFQSLPVGKRGSQDAPSDALIELTRRQHRIFDGYLAAAYPAQNDEERWRRMLENPPKPMRTGQREEVVEKIVAVMQHQLDKVPHLREEKINVSISVDRGTQSAHALLRCGFSVSQFESDLVADLFKHLIKALESQHNLPEPFSLLWAQVVESLARDDPHSLGRLPRELTQPGINLKQLCAQMKGHEKESMREMLEICVQTRVVSQAPRRGPRL